VDIVAWVESAIAARDEARKVARAAQTQAAQGAAAVAAAARRGSLSTEDFSQPES
jgi:hypothetical protein